MVREQVTVMDKACVKVDAFAGTHTTFRSPQRISVTVPYGTYQKLLERRWLTWVDW